MRPMDILDAIFLRTPCREFTGEPIPDATLEAILEGARWGPSAMNVHNHRTMVVRDPETKEFLAENMEETARAFNRFGTAGQYLSRLWWLPEEARPAVIDQAQKRASSSYLARADTLLLAFTNPNWFDTLGIVYEAIGTVTTAKACANMWVAATALGVGASFHMASFADPRRQEVILDRLGVPRTWKLLGVLALGMPKHKSRARAPKFPLESIAFKDYWGRPWKRVAFRNGSSPAGERKLYAVEALDAIRLRRSARGFKTGPEGHVPDWKIEVLLEAARCAPSPFNAPSTRFLVIRDPETKKFIGQCGREAGQMVFGAVPWEEVSNRMWYVPEAMLPRVLEETTSGELFAYPENASAIIIPLTSVQWLDIPITLHDPTPFLTSLAMSIQNMWLATTALGVGLGYNGLPFIDLRKRGTILRRLGVPDSWLGNWTLNIGVPEHRRMAGPPRWPLEVVAFEERWGRRYRRSAFRELRRQSEPVLAPRPVPASAEA